MHSQVTQFLDFLCVPLTAHARITYLQLFYTRSPQDETHSQLLHTRPKCESPKHKRKKAGSHSSRASKQNEARRFSDQRREENTHASVLPLTERHVHIPRTQSEASSPVALYTAALRQRLGSNERTDHAETPPQATTMQTVLPLSKGPDRTKVPPARCSPKRIPEMQTVTRLFCLPRSQCLHAYPCRRLKHVHLGTCALYRQSYTVLERAKVLCLKYI